MAVVDGGGGGGKQNRTEQWRGWLIRDSDDDSDDIVVGRRGGRVKDGGNSMDSMGMVGRKKTRRMEELVGQCLLCI